MPDLYTGNKYLDGSRSEKSIVTSSMIHHLCLWNWYTGVKHQHGWARKGKAGQGTHCRALHSLVQDQKTHKKRQLHVSFFFPHNFCIGKESIMLEIHVSRCWIMLMGFVSSQNMPLWASLLLTVNLAASADFILISAHDAEKLMMLWWGTLIIVALYQALSRFYHAKSLQQRVINVHVISTYISVYIDVYLSWAIALLHVFNTTNMTMFSWLTAVAIRFFSGTDDFIQHVKPQDLFCKKYQPAYVPAIVTQTTLYT